MSILIMEILMSDSPLSPLWEYLLKDDIYVIEEYEGGRRVIMKIVKKYREEQFEV